MLQCVKKDYDTQAINIFGQSILVVPWSNLHKRAEYSSKNKQHYSLFSTSFIQLHVTNKIQNFSSHIEMYCPALSMNKLWQKEKDLKNISVNTILISGCVYFIHIALRKHTHTNLGADTHKENQGCKHSKWTNIP